LPDAPATAPPTNAARVASLGLIALVLFCLLWELVLAPLRPGGSWLALKALPLALLLPSALRGTRRTLQWLSLLLPFYVAEGIVRGFTESGRHSLVAWVAAAIATAAFVALLAWVRSDDDRRRTPGAPDARQGH
jgi:uncharacterized membrane protein